MRTMTLGSLVASPSGEIQGMIDGINRIIPLLVSVPSAQRFRSIIADDVAIDGELFSPEAFEVIRSGHAAIFPVPENALAVDGRLVREFLPVWGRIVAELGLTGAAKINPVAEITSRNIHDSISRLSDARSDLAARVKGGPPKKRSLWAWILASTGATVGATLIARRVDKR